MSRPAALAALLLAVATALPTSAFAADAVDSQPYIVVLKGDGDLAAADSPKAARQAPGRAVVEARGKAIDAVTTRHTVKAEERFEHVASAFSAKLTLAEVRALQGDGSVEAVVPDEPIELASQSMPTGVSRIGGRTSPAAHIDGIDDRVDVDVAVVDTGIDRTHPDLNVVGGVNCSTSDRSAWQDDNHHGTHVAGTIGALDNGIGVVGVAPGARLWAVRILDAKGDGLLSWYVCGLDWIAAQRDPNDPSRPLIEVVNMSVAKWGSDDGHCGAVNADILHAAICRLVASGVTVVAAAGNDATLASKRVPAAYDEVITVSALADLDGKSGGLGAPKCYSWGTYDVDDTFANFSNYGADVDLIAPGKCIWSTLPGNTYGWSSGTSMAAPHVAGAAALYIATREGVTPVEVRQALRTLGTMNWRYTTDPDAVHEPLLMVDRIGPLGTITMASSPATITAPETGGTFKVALTLTRPTVSEDLQLKVSGLPSGVTATLDKSHLYGFDATTANLTLTVPPGLASSAADVTIEAIWHGSRGKGTVHLVLESDKPTASAPGFNIRAGEMLGSTNVPAIVSWPAATDPSSGIAGYQLGTKLDTGAWASAPVSVTSQRTWLTPGHTYAWSVRARDAAGNWSDWAESRAFKVLSISERSSAARYSGTWSTTYTSLAYGGSRKTTVAKGATATFTINGTSAVLVGTMGPTRGSGELWVDGRFVTYVHSYSATVKNRAILAYVQLGAGGTHTVMLRNSATAGHSRMDVDGLILVR